MKPAPNTPCSELDMMMLREGFIKFGPDARHYGNQPSSADVKNRSKTLFWRR